MTNGRAAGGPRPGALASESDDFGVTVPGTGVAGGHSGSVGLPPSDDRPVTVTGITVTVTVPGPPPTVPRSRGQWRPGYDRAIVMMTITLAVTVTDSDTAGVAQPEAH